MQNENETKKSHISASQIGMYSTCGESYRRRYINGDIVPPSIAMLTGTAGHKAIQINNEQKISSKKSMNANDIKDLISDSVEEQFEKEYIVTEEEKALSKETIKGNVKNSLIPLASSIEEASGLYQPISVEETSFIEIPSIKQRIKFIMDVETDDGRIIDNKFSSKKKTQVDADTNPGLTVYTMAYMAKHKKRPSGIQFHNFISSKSKNELAVIDTTRTKEDLTAFYNRIVTVTMAIDSGVFPPAQFGSWKCSPRFCGYYSTCKYVNRSK